MLRRDISIFAAMSISIRFFELLIIGALFLSCEGGKQENQIELTVAVAANAQFAMEVIAVAFEEQTKKNIEIVIGSSGKLTAQIKQGAPYDILVAANMKYPNYLYQEGLATTNPKVYALGELVIWTIAEDLDMTKDLSFLKNLPIQKIALANPKNAPYGKQAINALNYYDLKEALNPKLVFGESIAQTNQYITTRNCEVGFTAKSVVLAPKLENKGSWVAVPKNAYQSIEQGVIITKYGTKEHPETAQAFYNFLFSTTAQRIFQEYGYTMPN